MDYTTYHSLAKPEDGARNAGNAMNGNMDILDTELQRLHDYMIGISSSSSSSSSSESSSSSSLSSSSSSESSSSSSSSS